MSKVVILGVSVDAQLHEAALSRLLAAAREGPAKRAHFATVHSVVEATSSPDLRRAFETAWMVCTDGMPLAWVARLRGFATERVAGPDVMLSLCNRGRSDGLRHYFLGGGPGTAERLRERLVGRYPGLEVVGVASPPFRPLTDEEDAAVVAAINQAQPDVLWIGLGAPKQELWAAAHESRLACHLVLPVGAAFDFHSGRLRRAPRWMRRIGLEWLFRTAMEPRRLLARYVTTNTRFMLLVAREEWARRRGSQGPSNA